MRASAARASSRLASIWAGEGGDEGCKGAITGEDWSLASLGENGREVEWGPVWCGVNVMLVYKILVWNRSILDLLFYQNH